MDHRVASALRRVRRDLDSHLDEAAVHDACHRAGHRWRDAISATLIEYQAYGHHEARVVQNTKKFVDRAIHRAGDVTGIEKAGIETKYPPVN